MKITIVATLLICAIATQAECSIKTRIAKAQPTITNIKQDIKTAHRIQPTHTCACDLIHQNKAGQTIEKYQYACLSCAGPDQ